MTNPAMNAGFFQVMPGEMRNAIYEAYLTNPDGLFIELDSTGIYAKGTKKDRMEFTSLFDKSTCTVFELKPEFVTSEAGNQVLRSSPFNLNRWLNARKPYRFSNVKNVIVHCGRFKACDARENVCMTDMAKIEYSIPLDSRAFLNTKIELSICITVECPIGEDIQLILSLRDIAWSISHVHATMKAQRSTIQTRILEREEKLGTKVPYGYQAAIWESIRRSERQVVEFVKTLSVTMKEVRDQWRRSKVTGHIRTLRKRQVDDYQQRDALRKHRPSWAPTFDEA